MMNDDFYLGQVFKDEYPPMAAIWCRFNNAEIKAIGDNYYQIVPSDPVTVTRERQSAARKAAYELLVDPLHSEKNRKVVLGTWTDALEAQYEENVRVLSEQIAKAYPYPDEVQPTPPQPEPIPESGDESSEEESK